MIGQRFGRLVVTGERIDGKHRWCTVRCDCGTERRVRASSLRSGDTTSCGCWASERMASMNFRHGDTIASQPTPEWVVWRTMRQRCEDPSSHSFDAYGGRGIRVCERWSGEDGFSNFLADMGRRPTSRHQIDRRDNDGDYAPENCRWATPSEQARNRRSNRLITAHGRTQCLAAWSEETGLPRSVIARRLDRGLAPDVALALPLGSRLVA